MSYLLWDPQATFFKRWGVGWEWGSVTLLPSPCLTSGPITLGPQSTFTIKFPSLVLFISQTKGNDSPQSHLEWVGWCHTSKQGVPRGILTPIATPFPRGALPKWSRRGKSSRFPFGLRTWPCRRSTA